MAMAMENDDGDGPAPPPAGEVARRRPKFQFLAPEEATTTTATTTTEAEHDADNDECPTPLPTKEIARRKTVEQRAPRGGGGSHCHWRNRRRTTAESLATFTSQTSFGTGGDPNKIVEVGDLRFLNDHDALLPEGQSALLGKGAFATVRLARRVRPPPLRVRSTELWGAATRTSMVSNLTDASPDDDKLFRISNLTSSTMSTNHAFAFSMMSSAPDGMDLYGSDRALEDAFAEDDAGGAAGGANGGADELVAVKIFEKAVLQKCRTVERDARNQMQVRTAYDKVEREIALMRTLRRHPNLVSLLEVIDGGSHRLYMALEYAPLGEIMTNVRGTGTYNRKPIIRGGRDLLGVTADGHFDEHHAALYFVDIMHGLAHLHKNRIVHRDLKPENILLDARGVAKIGDLGVAHLFEDERSSVTSSTISPISLDSLAVHNEMGPAGGLSRGESEAALTMKSMADKGKLTRTEGTWAFWSPEMCEEDSLVFSGYSCDIWAAGICLYIFATGKLPFYSEIPMALFDMIAAADVKLDGLNLSHALVDLLKQVLAKNPGTRAGVGDCLTHPFCDDAREQRLRELGEGADDPEEVAIRNGDDAPRGAFSKPQRMSLKKLTSGLKKRISRSSLAPIKSAGDVGVDDDEGGARRTTIRWGNKSRRSNKSAPRLSPWRSGRSSRETADMTELEEGEEEGAGELPNAAAARKRNRSVFGRSSAFFRQRGRCPASWAGSGRGAD